MANESFFKVSLDGRRVAYITYAGDKQFVTVDYMKYVRDKQSEIVESQGGEPYDSIGPDTLAFSPNSQRVAYVAQKRHKRLGISVGVKMMVVVMEYSHRGWSEKEETLYDVIGKGSLLFSPDSRRVAYSAQLRNKWFMIVDRKEEGPYDGILARPLTFSPNSQRLGYTVKVGSKMFAVVDGKGEKSYDCQATIRRTRHIASRRNLTLRWFVAK